MAKQAIGSGEEVPGQKELTSFIDEVEGRLEAIEKEYLAGKWALYMGRSARALQKYEAERAALLLDEGIWLTVMRWLNALSPAHAARRRLILLGRRLIPAGAESQSDVYTLRNELEADLLSIFPRLGKADISWAQLHAELQGNPNRRVRERAWKALVPVAKTLRDRFLELAQRRNYWARKQGYATYIDLALAPQGLSRDSILERYVELEEVTASSYRSFLGRMQRQLQGDGVAPWDIPYLIEARLALATGQPAVEAGPKDVVALIEALGLSWNALHVKRKVTDRLPYFSLCWPVEVPSDIRVAESAHQVGWVAYLETARAYGQALLAGLTRQTSFLLRDDAPAYRAGMGAFLARLASEPDWLRRRQMVPEARLPRIPQAVMDLQVLRLRLLMALSVFEYQVYEAPESDLDATWGEIQEAFLLLPNEPWKGWAAIPDYILRPIQLQDEIIGEIIASQAIGYLYQRFGFLFNNPELTEFLKESFYGTGAAEDWTDKVRAATGKFLSNKALFGELVGEE